MAKESKNQSSKAKNKGGQLAMPMAAEVEVAALDDYVRTAYRNYSMYVILDRALPHITDGLKPVQRRIVYAMSELGLNSGAKYKKSARTIGDVIGKFHPHGDSACYDAMVLLAQDFNMRYCLVDGQGNWGSVDNAKSFAAMRYTESRLTPYARLLLDELSRATTDWQDNFDGTLQEPLTLPAQVPNIILNGATGIAVGMTTEIPSHNITEVIDACLLLLSEPELTNHITTKVELKPQELLAKRTKAVKQLMTKLPAPDFASGGCLISSKEELRTCYINGTGTLKLRCKYSLAGNNVIISELPPQVSTYRIIEQLQQQVQNKKLPMLADLQDESDNDKAVQLVLKTRKGTDQERLMAHLFATTDLEKNLRVNINAISQEGRPRIWSLDELLHNWLEYRRSCVIKRLQSELAKIESRLEILAGLSRIFLDLDEVLRIIRTDEQPKAKLISRFKLTERQAEAILETKLRNLAKLEEEKLAAEEEALTDKKYYLETTLKSKAKITELLKAELQQIRQNYGDKRRTELLTRTAELRTAESFTDEQLVNIEPATLILSQQGWVRLAKGHELNPREISYRSGDGYLIAAQGYNNQTAVFLDSQGRVYNLPALSLPSARGLGEPLSTRLDLADGVKVQAGLLGQPGEQLLLVAGSGYGFIVSSDELLGVTRKKGKQLMSIKDAGGLVQPLLLPKDWQENKKYRVCCLTALGRLLILPLTDIPQLNKGKGIKLIGLTKEHLKQLLLLPPGHAGLQLLDDRMQEIVRLQPAELAKFAGKRGNKGKFLAKQLSTALTLQVMLPDSPATA